MTVKKIKYEQWGFKVSDDFKVEIPEAAIPIGIVKGGKNAVIQCLVPEEIAIKLEEERKHS